MGWLVWFLFGALVGFILKDILPPDVKNEFNDKVKQKGKGNVLHVSREEKREKRQKKNRLRNFLKRKK